MPFLKAEKISKNLIEEDVSSIIALGIEHFAAQNYFDFPPVWFKRKEQCLCDN